LQDANPPSGAFPPGGSAVILQLEFLAEMFYFVMGIYVVWILVMIRIENVDKRK